MWVPFAVLLGLFSLLLGGLTGAKIEHDQCISQFNIPTDSRAAHPPEFPTDSQTQK